MEGGSCNSYEYTCGDPVNGTDLSGTKNRGLNEAEAKRVGEIAADCLYGPDAGFSGSAFCGGFLNGLKKGDLTDYGFGFEPARARYPYATIRKYVLACGQNAFTGAVIGSIGGTLPGAGVGALSGCASGIAFQIAKDEANFIPDKYIDAANYAYDLYNLRAAGVARAASGR